MHEFQQEILLKYQATIFNTNDALVKLFIENRFEDLSILFKLYQPVKDGLLPVSQKFKAHMMEVGRGLIQSCETVVNGKEINLKELI